MSKLPRLNLRICSPDNHKTTESITNYINTHKAIPNSIRLIGACSIQLRKTIKAVDNYIIHLDLEKYPIKDVKEEWSTLLNKEYGLDKSYSLTELKKISKQPICRRKTDDGFKVEKIGNQLEDNLSKYFTALFLKEYALKNDFGLLEEESISLKYPIEVHIQDVKLHDETYGASYKYYITKISVKFLNKQMYKV